MHEGSHILYYIAYTYRIRLSYTKGKSCDWGPQQNPKQQDAELQSVKEWSDVTKELLETTVNTFKDKKFNYDKLLMSYWVNKIHSYKKH